MPDYAFDVYYGRPEDTERESDVTVVVARYGGQLDYREVPREGELGGICLTYEFSELQRADRAAEALRQMGEHVEGPYEYGP